MRDPIPAFGSVLIANRGEIATRIIRACRDAGLRSVAVYADPDRASRYVRLADEAQPLPGVTALETYLDPVAILAAARESGAQAVHPGYGFLSEDAEFAEAVEAAGLVWIGPPPSAMRALGNKVSAREIAVQVGAPLVPGTLNAVTSSVEIEKFAAEHGFPIAIKAAFGGGGRGMKVANTMAEIEGLFESAGREARMAFGRAECFVERYLPRARHVEAQMLADVHGGVVVVGTRDCSLQRRHQKLVEEAPAPFLTVGQVEQIEESASAICRAAGYRGAGTVEYLLAEDGTLSFLEVNTRLQVEHPVTEETTGVDLVLEQFNIAAGGSVEHLRGLQPHGHAFEFRINCEDPVRNFVPTPGVITHWIPPEGPGVRVDGGVEAGHVVSEQFDSMIAKVIVTGRDRTQALGRARRALHEMEVDGTRTVLPFHRAVLDDSDFTAADGEFRVHTRWIDETFVDRLTNLADEDDEAMPRCVPVRVGDSRFMVDLPGLSALEGAVAERVRASIRDVSGVTDGAASGSDRVESPMQGTVVKLAVANGDVVTAGQLIAVVEAMKMENPVRAPSAGVVAELSIKVADSISQDSLICRVVGD
jgi:acetyl-CoA/propionyl-CoA carboxylase biotin carboxyl carrier protein